MHQTLPAPPALRNISATRSPGPVDRIAQDGSGAFATREVLQRDPDRLTGKRLVVYQFAARELTIGDWT
jgi:hypothetical protein